MPVRTQADCVRLQAGSLGGMPPLRCIPHFGTFEFPASIPIWAVHAPSSIMESFRNCSTLASEQVPTVQRPGQPAVSTEQVAGIDLDIWTIFSQMPCDVRVETRVRRIQQ